ncbi:class I SAM-dependent methyltransferase [Bosea sp. (in: a-proteobacteria)]|uniref:class I SAM-dependent methyltransferase n=1 Tax=Bosea sp. (in: a-proteobacteria) TaxID=1871050 RepID=UPI002628B1EB|nr:class I SAM-dependent methyltransferase [Bosea sp. (in: a-proteobacteria)]MCO5091584.1 class I SAM-dependent methyltransferase [Bosea sp. (in: a-proteobacteria)]
MAGFSPEWLALREPADHAARNPQVLAAVGGYFAGSASLSVLDLGCGAGSNLRAACAALPDRQHWTLVDHDAGLLALARTRLEAWADEAREQGEELVLAKGDKTITVDTRKVDLDKDLDWVLGWRPDLVTAAALFDLASKRWIERFVAALTSQCLPLYAALTYDGRESWQPEHSADAGIHAAFDDHQHGDKGFGPAAGPEAHEIMAEAFRKSGFAVSSGDSAWLLDAFRRPLLEALAQGIAAAAGETGRLDADTVSGWLAARRKAQSALIGHQDLWARPV